MPVLVVRNAQGVAYGFVAVAVDVVGVVAVGTVKVVVGRTGMLGIGTVSIGLRPLLPISVESSGMVPPLRANDPPAVPVGDITEAIPLDETPADGQGEVVVPIAAVLTDMGAVDVTAPEPIVVVPPPSNVEVVIDVVPALLVPIAAE
jgi:hypothetical protein